MVGAAHPVSAFSFQPAGAALIIPELDSDRSSGDSEMSSSKRGAPPQGQGLRDALRWLSEQGSHDAAAVEAACQRFDLSPLDEEFLLAEARRLRAAESKRDNSTDDGA
jgi:hypothetical protein